MSRLPNSLTIARVALVPAFVAAFFWPGDAGLWAAFALFLLAGATDAVDGFVARKLDAESEFGKMLDPIADKMMVSAALLMLVANGIVADVHLIPALVILCREILVSGLREFLATADVSLPVTRIAKMKTTLQMLVIGALILSPILDRILPGVATAAIIGLWLAAALTLYTGVAYFQAGVAHTRRERATRMSPPARPKPVQPNRLGTLRRGEGPKSEL